MIQYFGLDVHTNFTAIAIAYRDVINDTFEIPKVITVQSSSAEIIIKAIEPYIQKSAILSNPYSQIIMGYEAGCLGFSLQRDLTAKGFNCVIMAPSTMAVSPLAKSCKKNDRRDAIAIAKCLAERNYSKVYVPDLHDNAVAEYIRMRDEVMNAIVVCKQQISSFCHRHGYHFNGKSTWTNKHRQWLSGLNFKDSVLGDALKERLILLEQLEEKCDLYDKRIQELSEEKRYQEFTRKLECFIGMGTNSALAFVTEIGDFSRFKSGTEFSAFLGLVPGQHTSNAHGPKLGITKAGNTHLRKNLILASQSICRGRVGAKSKHLKKRQAGMPQDVVDYADRANQRLRRRYYQLIAKGKCRNVSVTAIAREYACFIWGMMTGNLESKPAASRKKVKVA